MNLGPELDRKLESLEPAAKEIALRMIEGVLYKHVGGPREEKEATANLELIQEAYTRVGEDLVEKAVERARGRVASGLKRAMEDTNECAHVVRSARKSRSQGRNELKNSWGGPS